MMKPLSRQSRRRVVPRAGGQLAGDDFVQVVEDQMQLEAKEPAHRGFAVHCRASEGLLRWMRRWSRSGREALSM
jgi:hypothetical protein